MRPALDIAGVVLLLQGLGPLVQEGLGEDSSDSVFLVNSTPALMPWAAIVVTLAGAALLGLSQHLRQRARPA